jgi:hypothetical protein
MSDVSADALPVRGQRTRPIIADPGLQIRSRTTRKFEGCTRGRDRFGGREPKEVSTREAHFGPEKIMITGSHQEGRPAVGSTRTAAMSCYGRASGSIPPYPWTGRPKARVCVSLPD